MKIVEDLVQLLVVTILAFMLAIVFAAVFNVLRLVSVYESKLEKLRALELILVDRDRDDLESCRLSGGRIKMNYNDGKSITYEIRYSPSNASKVFYRVAKVPGSRPGYNLVYENGDAVSITSEASGKIIVVEIDGLRIAFSGIP